MISRTNEPFRKAFARLPPTVREQARAAYRLFRQNPYHPGLQFKQVSPNRPIYSVRVSTDYRALGRREDDNTIVWYWIGSHADYDKLLTQC
jgi:hypothetical protein